MDLLSELVIFLRERRCAWLPPVVILALIVAGMLALSSGLLDVFAPSVSVEHLAPFSRGHYRQDLASFSRYSAIRRWPARLG
jgi:hypothetical protein